MIICGNLVPMILSITRHVKLMNIQIFRIVHVKNVFSKLVLPCEDEMLINTTKTSLDDKKVTKIIALFTLLHW